MTRWCWKQTAKGVNAGISASILFKLKDLTKNKLHKTIKQNNPPPPQKKKPHHQQTHLAA